MQMKIKFNYEWHWRTPDGEEEFETVVDWFDTQDSVLHGQKMQEAFKTYTRETPLSRGSTKSYTLHGTDLPQYAYGGKHSMIADVENVLRDFVDVLITTEFVIEHEGRYFKCEEIFLTK